MYSFQPFLDALDTNWYQDDECLQRLLARHAGPALQSAEPRLVTWGERAATDLRLLAEESARPENAPFLRSFDAHNNRIDEIVLPASTRRALAEVEGTANLGATHGDPFVFYALGYLYSQNGEAGVGCSMACTDGMVRVLQALGDAEVHRRALREIRESTPERVVHGAQFVTEIQGGSDVPANAVRAVPDGDGYRLHGQKWFCSNINADWFLITARPDGASDDGRGVALFLVPAYLDGARPRRNGYTIDRLKDKLGTRELATAEVTFDGARAWPVGALDRGIANVVNYVLVTSRFACGSFAASSLRRAERIVTAYTDFRTAFGRRLVEFPLVRETLAELRSWRERSLASLFRLLALWQRAEASGSRSQAALDFRVLTSLCKPVLTQASTHHLHEAMMMLGANGIEERFGPLPRLYRDSVIMETWEGPHNVLYSQALRDLVRFEVDPAAFVERLAGEPRPELAADLAKVMRGATDLEATVPFARLAPRLVEVFADRALAE